MLSPAATTELHEIAVLTRELRRTLNPLWLAVHHFDSVAQAVELIGDAAGPDPDLAAIARLADVHAFTDEDLRTVVGQGNLRPVVLRMHLDGVPRYRIWKALRAEGMTQIRINELLERVGLKPTVTPQVFEDTGAQQSLAARLYVQGKSYREIGEALGGIRHSQVQRHLRNAVKNGLLHPSQYGTRIKPGDPADKRRRVVNGKVVGPQRRKAAQR